MAEGANGFVQEGIPVGTRVVVYANAPELGAIIDGRGVSALGHDVYLVEIAGRSVKRSARIVVAEADFAASWHVWRDGQIIAGGPGIGRVHLDDYAARHGGKVIYGWPTGSSAQLR